MVVFWMQFIPWTALIIAWMLAALAALFFVAVLSIIRWTLTWIEHGLTTLCGAAIAVLFRVRPVPPQGTKPPSDPTATASVTEASL